MKQHNYKSMLKFILGGAVLALICASVPTSGAYVTDVTQVQVNNSAQDAVSQINQILCVIANTNYSAVNTDGTPKFIGQGNILAQVDQSMCQTGGNPGQQSNGTNASGTTNYLNIIFNAPARASNNDPQTAKMWITGNVGGGNGEPMPVLIEATLSVSQTPSTTNPYGLFDFEFTGYPQGLPVTPANAAMKGYIHSELNSDGQQQLSFVQTQGGGQGGQSAKTQQLILLGNGIESGYGQVMMPDFGPGGQGQTQQLALSYNSGNLLQEVTTGGASTDKCFNRNDIESVVYQYGLYNNDGSPLVHENSAYPVIINGQQGFLNYYGLGLPNGQVITTSNDGESLTYIDSPGGTLKNGKLIVKSGKMSTLNTKTFTLGELTGMQLSVPEAGTMGSPTNKSDIIQWSKITQSFLMVGTQSCDQSGCATSAVTPITYGSADFAKIIQISGTGIDGSGGVGTVNFWLNGLGAGGNTQLQVATNCTMPPPPSGPNQQPQPGSCSNYATLTNESSLAIWDNSLVIPGATESKTTYYCVSQCPYLNDSGEWVSGQPGFDGSGVDHQYITYRFDPVAYTLTGTSGLANDESIAVTPQQGGQIMSGPLLTASQYNSILRNGFPDMAKLYDGTITSYLQWQSGSGFNQYVGVADSSGTALPLNAPLQLTYTNPVTGGNTFLQYSGVGNLQGVPGECVDQNESPVGQNQCGQPGYTWIPTYNITSGAQVSDVTGTNSYWVKQLFVSQIMKANGSCGSLQSNLTLAKALTLPTLSGFTPVDNGPMPNVTKPSIIDGVNQ